MRTPCNGYRLVNGAWIHPSAHIGDGVTIEPGAVIGADVHLGKGNWVGTGAVIYGPSLLGDENEIHPSAVLGGAPQDLSYHGEPTRLEIGSRNVFRESVTISRASTKGEGVTRIGSNNYFMAGSHVGHDSVVGDDVVLANGVLIAGHCRLGSNVNMAGGAAIVQFTTVGRYAFLGGHAGSTTDLEPFMTHDGVHSSPKGVNSVSLRRANFPSDVIQNLKVAFRA